MAFLVYLTTEVKGNLNTPFPLISHTDVSYTRNFLLQEYSWQSTFFMTKQMKQGLFALGLEILWFTEYHDYALGVVLRQFSGIQLGCCLLGTFKQATSFKFSPVSFITIQSFFLIWNISICPDIDECSVFPSMCDINAICRKSEGSYLCSCKVGFARDGKACKSKANNL